MFLFSSTPSYTHLLGRPTSKPAPPVAPKVAVANPVAAKIPPPRSGVAVSPAKEVRPTFTHLRPLATTFDTEPAPGRAAPIMAHRIIAAAATARGEKFNPTSFIAGPAQPKGRYITAADIIAAGRKRRGEAL